MTKSASMPFSILPLIFSSKEARAASVVKDKIASLTVNASSGRYGPICSFNVERVIAHCIPPNTLGSSTGQSEPLDT